MASGTLSLDDYKQLVREVRWVLGFGVRGGVAQV